MVSGVNLVNIYSAVSRHAANTFSYCIEEASKQYEHDPEVTIKSAMVTAAATVALLYALSKCSGSKSTRIRQDRSSNKPFSLLSRFFQFGKTARPIDIFAGGRDHGLYDRDEFGLVRSYHLFGCGRIEIRDSEIDKLIEKDKRTREHYIDSETEEPVYRFNNIWVREDNYSQVIFPDLLRKYYEEDSELSDSDSESDDLSTTPSSNW